MFYLSLFRNISWTIYSGLILAFAILILFKKAHRTEVLNWFKDFGVILGLSLGGTILPSIVLKWQSAQHFYPETYNEKMGIIVGFAMWVSNIILEIWTLDPLRKRDLGLLDDSALIDKAEAKSKRHLVFHAILVLFTHLFFGAI